MLCGAELRESHEHGGEPGFLRTAWETRDITSRGVITIWAAEMLFPGWCCLGRWSCLPGEVVLAGFVLLAKLQRFWQIILGADLPSE